MLECSIYGGFGGLHDLPTDHHFVQDLVHFVKVEHQVELAHGAKVLIQYLHKEMNEL